MRFAIRAKVVAANAVFLAALAACASPEGFAGGSSGGSSGGGGGSDAGTSGSPGADGAPSTDGSPSTSGGDAQGDGASAPPCTTCARDWVKYPPIAQIDGASELWVVSDAHGDYKTFSALLAGAKVMPSAPSSPAAAAWSAGSAVLVIVGDLIDKGPDAPDLVRMVIALQSAASAAGGRVVVTMGNHEAEFLADPMNSKASGSDGIDPELQSIGLTPQETASGNDDIGAFVRGLPFAARVDDWFFAHAGKTDGKTLAQLASDLQTGVDSAGFGAPVLSASDSLLEARLASSGPQWWDATNDAQTLLGQWTQALGAKHLVMGHQPGSVGFADGTKRSSDKMYQAYGGLLFLVDTGLSVDVDATGGALLHVTGVGTPSVAWTEVLPTGATKSL